MQAPDDFNPTAGIAVDLQPGLWRILAPNPSPMTYRGTNTYLLGDRDIAVIDPGPENEAHLNAILDALKPGQKISHIVVTHTHLDHSPLAAPLSQRSGAPIYAFGGPEAGRSDVMTDLVAQGMTGGGEGIDSAFRPDVEVEDGEVIAGDGWQLEVIHTPGHLGNHIALGWQNTCFTADHVMGWASSLVSPPDGDLTDFMAACRRLRARSWSVFHAGHGAPITNPAERLDWLIQHRLTREAQILSALEQADGTARQLAERIYTDTPTALLPAAERNVFAHLVDLFGKNKVLPRGEMSVTAKFHRIG
ncbi:MULTISPECIES: MBL fold metallo-hydrolase [unclassified Ruegeria]|uniref:MBL fold metallo-hydrolase n=1 Tax=unclassified Ruegeria TaxID=2625375 RepID=UPI001489240D|nr:MULTISPECIES: MBL fold metallo-hydrolase [unclassified Ruegeria]NOD75547.1 MBL fold metallo-hydrolase [Ruegeria sp. HKCCD4332]NOD87529.1 MBL fold metallo-hydrolase [Ruegeria sp. HKCCD4318]NOE13084.1 MBL fold metallo-hydrolase [Ruegeria sp. HKCCD4318-2]NOG08748.1 MBL fold metallo-hydrolase [Ruegeria sp. HKCCD4315]